MLIAVLLLMAIAAREIYLHHWLGRSACIGIRRQGWIVVEIRRRVAMERLPGHVSAYPVPREERILVSRVFGLVLRHREVSVALPESAIAHLEAVMPQHFDSQFPNWLRLVNNGNG